MQPTELFDLINVGLLIKIGLIIIGIFYSFYAVLVIRQAHLMEKVLVNEENVLVSFLAYIHLFAALGLTALAVLS